MGKKAVFLLALLPFISCNKSDPTQPEFVLGSVAFDSGGTNVYAWSFGYRDSSGSVVVQASDTFLVRVAALNQTVGAMTGLFRLDAQPVDDDTMVTSVWYAQASSDLREVAYASPGRVPVVQPELHKWKTTDLSLLKRREFYTEPYLVRTRFPGTQSESDSITVRDEPRIVYRYPLAIGNQWMSFTTPFIQTREVIGLEDVSVPAGSFVCLRIRTKIPDLAPDLAWDDLVTTVGLVQRTTEMTVVRWNSDMIPVDTVTMVERLDMIQRR